MWFLDTIIPILECFKEKSNASPAYLTQEEWKNIIEKMIYCFKEVKENTCSQKNEYKKEFIKGHGNKDLDTKYLNREDEICRYRNNMKEEGFKLFSKYLWDLWY